MAAPTQVTQGLLDLPTDVLRPVISEAIKGRFCAEHDCWNTDLGVVMKLSMLNKTQLADYLMPDLKVEEERKAAIAESFVQKRENAAKAYWTSVAEPHIAVYNKMMAKPHCPCIDQNDTMNGRNDQHAHAILEYHEEMRTGPLKHRADRMVVEAITRLRQNPHRLSDYVAHARRTEENLRRTKAAMAARRAAAQMV